MSSGQELSTVRLLSYIITKGESVLGRKRMSQIESQIKDHAHEVGFDLVGIARATEADHLSRFEDWLQRDFAGEMQYMHRHAEARRHPSSILPEVQSVIMLGIHHAVEGENANCHIARYAWCDDYHDVIRVKLKSLLKRIQELLPDCRGRGVVDTAPLLERDFARRAGLGWFGKNTMLLNKHEGSFFFLAGLLLDVELEADAPHLASHCGSCTACLDACPTQAFPEPGMLDARRCISYLTIELRDSIDEELRPMMGEWLFGCDVCQEVCPWNRKAPGANDGAMQPRSELISLNPVELLSLTEEEFKSRFRGTAFFRPGREGLVRNAAIVLGNQGNSEALPALRKACHDPSAIVREAAQWAIEQILQRHRSS